VTRAWAFLRAGGAERFPGTACGTEDLPLWIGPELWSVELVEPIIETPVRLEAAAVRPVERVNGWDAARAEEFARAAVERMRVLGAAGHAGDGERFCLGQADPFRGAALASMIALSAAERVGAVEREREAQATFFRGVVGY
jgi:hypothetical protein